MNKIDLAGQVAVVTGGAQGLGFAIARRLIASGAKVSLWDMDADAAATAVAALGERRSSPGRRHHRSGWPRPCPSAPVETEVGPVSILVNSAGIAGKNAAARRL